MKVLVVDDDKMVLSSIAHFLRGGGIEVVTAENGVEAISVTQDSKIDLIISDIMMPGISGLSFLSILRSIYLNQIPVIMISSLDKADIIISSLGLGADDFLIKPLDLNKLYTRVKSYIKKE
jgi:DNA-binding response OmpR family regulator